MPLSALHAKKRAKVLLFFDIRKFFAIFFTFFFIFVHTSAAGDACDGK